MNPDITNIDTITLDNTLMGINMSTSHLIWSTIIVLVVSHIGAQYLAGVTPRGYWFWFTLINLIVGMMFL